MGYNTLLPKLNPCPPDVVFRLLPSLGPDIRLLDLGCGRGTTLSWLASHTPWSLWGADPDLDSCTAPPDRVTLVQAAAEHLPFADGSFDIVMMECVFSLCQPQQTLSQLRRILRPGGLVVLSDLFSRREESASIDNSLLVRRIDREDELTGWFLENGFCLQKRQDFSRELQAMAGQMILDGTACACLDPKAMAVLRACRAGYGLWLFKRL